MQDGINRIYEDYDLSRRHREICDLIMTGATNQQIADALFIEQQTVKNHISALHRQFGTTNRTQIAALLAGLIDPPKPSPAGLMRQRIQHLEACAYKLDELIHSGSCRIAPHHYEEALALLESAGIPDSSATRDIA
jgi:DNA-binding CsgD family transcriptional regulator